MCFLSLPHLHCSLAEPLACELAPKIFGKTTWWKGKCVPQHRPVLPPISTRRRSLACQQIKSHAVWRVFMVFARQDSEHHLLSFAEPYYDCTVLPSCRALLSLLWFVTSSNATCHVVVDIVVINQLAVFPFAYAQDTQREISQFLLFPFSFPPPCVNISMPSSSWESWWLSKQQNKHVALLVSDSTCMLFSANMQDGLLHVLHNYYGASSPLSCPLLCGKQATLSGETWVT